MTKQKNHYLSKSSFLKGVQCLKALYLSKHNPEHRDEISEGQQAIFNMGHEVGILAQEFFPGGTLAAKQLPEGFIESIKYTEELIQKVEKVIYEAGIMHDHLHCFVDILVKEGDRWKIYEVKSSTSVSNTHILDAAFQYHVLSSHGMDIEDISIVFINNKYVRSGQLDIHQLYTIESVLDKVLPIQDIIKERVQEQKRMLQGSRVPNIDIGLQCNDPYTCDFKGYCWKHIPDYSVFDIHNLHANKKFDLYDKGIIYLKDIPEDYPLGTKQRFQVKAELEQITQIDKTEIRKFLDDLEYPLYYFDFETMNPAIPQYNNNKPYQQIPFQYSLHIQDKPGSDVSHIEYLGNPSEDPRPKLIETMLDSIGDTGDIIAFNMSFEKARIKELARDFPEFKEPLMALLPQFVDLMHPFQKRHYYTHVMMGSYSIKKVLPALVPQFNYDDLDIGEGGLASLKYFQMVKGDVDDMEKIRKDLLEYCKMDTLGMVEILQVLKKSL